MASNHKYFEDQYEDEEVLFVFRKHPIVMRKGILLWAVGMLLGPLYVLFKVYTTDPTSSSFPTMTVFFGALIGSFILSLILFAPFYIGWYFSVFIITNQRFMTITQKGLFHRAVADVGLPQIQSVNYEVAGLQQTLFGFGTIRMQTYVGDVTIHDIHHPPKIQKRLALILRDQGAPNAPNPRRIQDSNDEEDE